MKKKEDNQLNSEEMAHWMQSLIFSTFTGQSKYNFISFTYEGHNPRTREPFEMTLSILDKNELKKRERFFSKIKGKWHPNIVKTFELEEKWFTKRAEIEPLMSCMTSQAWELGIRIESAYEHETIALILCEPVGDTILGWIEKMKHSEDQDAKIELDVLRLQVEVVRGLLEGLKYMHSLNVVSSSLSSSTVVFTKHVEGKSCLPVKIGCFGDDIGKAGYIHLAPEMQIYPNIPEATKASNMFSMGVVIAEVLTLVGRTTTLYKMLEKLQTKGHPIVKNAHEIVSMLTKEDPNERTKSVDEINLQITKDVLPTSGTRTRLNKLVSLLQDSNGEIWYANLEFKMCLGSGGFGLVLKAENVIDKSTSAVKIMVQSNARNEETTSEEKREKEFTNIKDCSHKNLVSAYQIRDRRFGLEEINEVFGNDNEEMEEHVEDFLALVTSRCIRWGTVGLTFIEMELCGRSLRDWIDGGYNSLTPDELNLTQIHIIYDVVQAIAYLHKIDILHRDIKPLNIYFSLSPTGAFDFPVKLGDFGLSRVLASNDVDVNGGSREESSHPNSNQDEAFGHLTSNAGTVLYSAPEVTTNLYGKQADIFSLGLVIWEVCQLIKKQDKAALFQSLVYDGDTYVVKDHCCIANSKETIVQMTKRNIEERLKSIEDFEMKLSPEIQFKPKDGVELELYLDWCPPGSLIKLNSSQLYEGNFEMKNPRVILQGSGTGNLMTSLSCPTSNNVISITAEGCILEDLQIFADPTACGIWISGKASNCIVRRVNVVGGLCGVVIKESAKNNVISSTNFSSLNSCVVVLGSENVLEDIHFDNDQEQYGRGSLSQKQSKECRTIIEFRSRKNTLRNFQYKKESNNLKYFAVIQLLGTSHVVENVVCKGNLSYTDNEWGIMAYSDNNKICSSQCQSVKIHGDKNVLIGVDCQDMMEICGYGNELDHCKGACLKLSSEIKGLPSDGNRLGRILRNFRKAYLLFGLRALKKMVGIRECSFSEYKVN